jgi:hypothetical protein
MSDSMTSANKNHPQDRKLQTLRMTFSPMIAG